MPFDVVFRTLQDPLESTLAGIAPYRAIVLSRFLTEYLLGAALNRIDERKDLASLNCSEVLASRLATPCGISVSHLATLGHVCPSLPPSEGVGNLPPESRKIPPSCGLQCPAVGA